MQFNYKKCSRKNEEEVQHTSYDRRHRSTMGRAFLMRHAY